jgi:hypothetical protein
MQEPLDKLVDEDGVQQMQPIGKGHDLLWRTDKESRMYPEAQFGCGVFGHYQGILPVLLVGMTRTTRFDAITNCPPNPSTNKPKELPSKTFPIGRFFQRGFLPVRRGCCRILRKGFMGRVSRLGR